MLCDGACRRWQHQICGTGIDRRVYRQAVRGETELEWKCNDCEATALAEAFLEWNPRFPEETTSMDVSVEEELMNASTSSASFQVPVEVQEISLADDPAIQGWCNTLEMHQASGCLKCQVMVRQEGDIFTRGTQEHLHAAESGAAVKAKLDLGFELDMRHWPDQFEDPVDITVGNKHHVLFFSKQQLTLLSQAKRWYADGTFKVVRAPFTQLWSIHAFVRVEDQTKQLPLAFAVMSGKRRRDYLAVLWALKQELRRRDLSWNLECVTMDFEAAAWAAFRAAFP
ncbi:hypothetical protein ACOMHN_064127 [Nucella lapillus]